MRGHGPPLVVSLAWLSVSRVGGLVCLDGRPSTSTFTYCEGHWRQRACGSQPLSSFLLLLKLKASCSGVWIIKEFVHSWRGFARGELGKNVARRETKKHPGCFAMPRLLKLSKFRNKLTSLPGLHWLLWLRELQSSHSLRIQTSGP